MKNLPCPQCEIHRFCVKNQLGESVVVMVSDNYEIIPIHTENSLDGYDLSTIYCLGCSWQGSPQSLRNGNHHL
jgi:hypothetical protein